MFSLIKIIIIFNCSIYMNNLDLNINNYSLDQLKQLLNIRQNDILNESLLNNKKEQYFRMILNDKSIEQNKVIKIINFITNAIDHLNKQNTFKHNYGENLNVQMTHPIVSKPETPFFIQTQVLLLME